MTFRPATPDAARGFTLVELLIVIAILALLASMVLFGMAGATQQAKIARTKAQIARLHELIMEEWEQYETRRPPIAPRVAGENSVFFAQRRLNAVRALMRMELPDRISDVRIDWNGDGNPNQPRTAAGLEVGGLMAVPAKMRAFDRFVVGHARNSSGGLGYAAWTTQYQGAECLYMIISKIPAGDGTALQFFAEKEIGDLDADGMPEILDAWGNPIRFLRWAPGYSALVSGQSPIQSGDARVQPDPFDLSLRGDPRNRDDDATNDTFALIPLIFSSGVDGVANIWWEVPVANSASDASSMKDENGNGLVLYRDTDLAPYDNNSPTMRVPNDPYVLIPTAGGPVWLGNVQDLDSPGHIDNLSNHLISTSIN